MTYKPDFKKACILANEILLKSRIISAFPFSVTKLIKEISDIQCCSFKRAQEYHVDIEAFGSDSAILTEYLGRQIIFYNQLDIDERVRFSMLHEIGHYLLGHDMDTDNKELYEKQEIETNFFAAQLLMPEQTLDFAVRLLAEMGTGCFDKLMEELQEIHPGSFALSRYNLYKNNVRAEKMHESIRGVLAEKLSVFSFDGAKAMFHKQERIQFAGMGREKTAVFLTVSDTDRSMDRLADLFFTQAVHTLCQSADRDYGDSRLAVPVRFLLDDFAAVSLSRTLIKSFPLSAPGKSRSASSCKAFPNWKACTVMQEP